MSSPVDTKGLAPGAGGSSANLKQKRSQRFTVAHNANPSASPPPIPSNPNAGSGSSPPPPAVQSQSLAAGAPITPSGGGPPGGFAGIGGPNRRDSYAGSEDSNPYSQASPTSAGADPGLGGFHHPGGHHFHSGHPQGSPFGGGSGGASGYFGGPTQGGGGGGGGSGFLSAHPQSQAYHQTGSPNHLGGTSPYGGPGTPMGSLKSRSQTAPTHGGNQLRGGLPSEWLQGSGAGASGEIGHGLDDDVIPTAIVVKNIPFNVKREQLLQIIDDLRIPAPYAFNYHFDDGIFRGLAFANFRTPDETDAAVAALNGFDVQGRKLRVEYKKVLKEGEKERIEREKAIKRMRSAVLDKERRERDVSSGGYDEPGDLNRQLGGMNLGGGGGGGSGFGTGGSGRGLPPALQQALGGGNQNSQAPPSDLQSNSSDRSSNKYELDMNDPQTLEIYSRVLLFKDDALRDELAFARSLGMQQRRMVHLVAQKLDLDHKSVGQGEARHVVVYKRPSGSKPTPLLSPDAAYPAATGARLAAKKSMPDMRGSSFYGSRDVSSLAGRKSNANLREGYASVGRKASNGSLRPSAHSVFGNAPGAGSLYQTLNGGPMVPPLPNLPSPFHSGGDDSASTIGVLRQPKGPETGSGFGGSRGFGRGGASTAANGNDGVEDINSQTHAPLEM